MLSLRFRLPAVLSRRPARFAPGLAFLMMVGGCSTGNYPSLEQRPAEQPVALGTPAATVAPDPAPATDLPANLATLVARARKAHQLFLSLQLRAESAANAAAHAAPDSDAAATVNLAFANLESARGEVAVVMADLDRLDTDDRLAHSLEGDATPLRPARAAIAAAQTEVQNMVRQEDDALAQLHRRAGQ